ncbi:MAG: ABC transporter ATP-binding protein [Leptospiraceae bacterium]|nr:ABC transporter ATP-binding protein [Leptospiraceae bacterium]
MMNKNFPVIHIQNLKFGYSTARSVLNIQKFTVNKGEKIFLFGPSGCGKSTLLSLLCGVLHSQSGMVEVLGSDFSKMKAHKRDIFRGAHIGYIFQQFNLLPWLTVYENIALPCHLNPERRSLLNGNSLHAEVERLCNKLGIDSLMQQKASELSIGQRQRVAAARAFIGNPSLILADEPTSSLDADHRKKFIDLMFENMQNTDSSLVFVSHDASLSDRFDRSVSLPEINLVN